MVDNMARQYWTRSEAGKAPSLYDNTISGHIRAGNLKLK
jgi:hypothetical protein